MAFDEMIPLEAARQLVVDKMRLMDVETVDILASVGRVCAAPVQSDIDVAPFAHACMDGFALRAAEIEGATSESPVQLEVIAEVGAGDVFDGAVGVGECVRIMTGAELPADVDAVVKYEIVDYLGGDGMPGSAVAFAAPTAVGSNIRQPGEEAKAGETILEPGEVISCAGVGYLASCGALEIGVYARPKVAIIPTGSELVPPSEVPTPGHIRESNAHAIAACCIAAGAVPTMMPIVADDRDALERAVRAAVSEHDFVITTGGAANGDFDFIKDVVADSGELLMTLVNMRPGKAQTFGIVEGTPVFGLPGNPAAAYCGFEMIIRPALRKMQGFTRLVHPHVMARITQDEKNKDPRRIFLRSTLVKAADGSFEVTPAKNQSSGLFGVIQRSNCMAVMPDGTEPVKKGDLVECILLDVPEHIEL